MSLSPVLGVRAVSAVSRTADASGSCAFRTERPRVIEIIILVCFISSTMLSFPRFSIGK